jgi:N-acetylneuraminic acid mutarotase
MIRNRFPVFSNHWKSLCALMFFLLWAGAAEAMEIYVAMENGATLTLEVEAGDSIENVKAKVLDQTGIPIGLQWLYYGQLLENDRTLSEYNIQNETTLNLYTTAEPMKGPWHGGNTVTIRGTNLCTGSDVTNVTLCGIAASSIVSASSTQVVVTVGAGPSAGTNGDAVVFSTSLGQTVYPGAYTYNPAGRIIDSEIQKDWSRWGEVQGLPLGLRYMDADTLNGKIVMAGGMVSVIVTNVYAFDGTNWMEVAGLPAIRRDVAISVLNGTLYAIGGQTASGPKNNVYAYDGTNWSTSASLPAARSRLRAGTLNGKIYAVGGSSSTSTGSGMQTNVYAFDGTNWSEVAGLPMALETMSVEVLNDGLYSIGGGGSGVTNVFRFDGTNWTEVAGLPVPRTYMGSAVLDGKIYAIGGMDFQAYSNVYAFDGTSWTQSAPLPAPRRWLAAGTLGDHVYAIGGNFGATPSTNTFVYPGTAMVQGVAPSNGSCSGNYPVTIAGTNLGNGADITNVTLCGVPATISSQTAERVWIRAGSTAAAASGDVRVYSVSYGETVKSNAFTYAASGILVSGSNFNLMQAGTVATNIFTVTNSGNEALLITTATNNGAGATWFNVSAIPSRVEPGTASNFPVVFTAGAVGTFDPVCYTVNNSPYPNYSFGLHASVFQLSTNVGPNSGGNTITITNGNFGTITNVLVGGVEAAIVMSGANWVTFTAPPAGTAGVKDIVIQTDGGDITFANAYTYNPAGVIGGEPDWSRWADVAGLPASRFNMGLAELSNRLYAVGGSDISGTGTTNVYCYDGSNWTEVPGLPSRRWGLIAGVVNDSLYVAGGSQDGSEPKTNAYRFTGTGWEEVPGVPAQLWNLSGAAFNGAFYAVGGGYYGSKTNVYRFDGTAWTEVAGLPAPRDSLAVGGAGGYLYAAGGVDANLGEDACTNVYRFDGTTWQEVVGLPAPRTLPGAAALGGALYVAGGQTSEGMFYYQHTNVFRFNGTVWTEAAGLPQEWSYVSLANLSGVLYGLGGSPMSTNVYRYPATVGASGVSPSSGSLTGGYPVVIVGSNLCDGADVTNVTLCGTAVQGISSQTPTQIVVVAGAGSTGLGDVRVYSVSYGETVKSNAFTYIKTTATLTIQSPYGAGVPPVGVYTHNLGAVLTNAMSSPDTQGSTQFVCSGWAMTGNDPASGASTQMVMTVTNDAVLSWLWTTNYLLTTAVDAHGSVLPVTGWKAFGSNVVIAATASAYYHFTSWTGDVVSVDNPLTVSMTGPRSVMACFAANMTTNKPTPAWWLAQYGITNHIEEAVNEDPDHDGVPTGDEWVMNTDPTSASAFLRMSQYAMVYGTNCYELVLTNDVPPYDVTTQLVCDVIGQLLTWPCATDRVYDVQYDVSVSSAGWLPLAGMTNLVPSSGSLVITNPLDANALKFYRLKVRLP